MGTLRIIPRPGRQAELAGELIEWWEDLWQRGMTSRVVLVAVPPGWGRTTVLNQLEAAASGADTPATLMARVSGRELPGQRGVQAAVLRDCLAAAAERHRVAELLGLDRVSSITQLGLGVGGLFVSGLATAAGVLVAGLAAGAAGKVWDDSPAGQDGALARTARAVAAASADVPVVVIIDDADWLDEDLAVTLIENLAARHAGHVLVVAAVNPGGSLQRVLRARARQGLTEGRVQVADTDPDMSYESRRGLVRELCPRLPGAAVRRVAHATMTFADVFAVTSAPRLAELTSGLDEVQLVKVADEVIAARLHRPDPSPEAVIIAWAGGLLHTRQADRALDVLGQLFAAAGDLDVLRHGDLERVVAPASPRLAGQVRVLPVRDRQAMASAVLGEAVRITADPGGSLAGRMAAAQAAHHVRADLPSPAGRAGLPAIQRHLAAALEELGDPAAALQVATAAREEWPPGSSPADRDWLEAAVLRLHTANTGPASPLAAQLIAEAVAGGAGLGLEASIWACAELLADSGQHETALILAEQITDSLEGHADALGTAADQWRLLLAFHTGRAGYPALAGRLLAPLLNSGGTQREDAASAVLYACDGPGADTRLQNIILEAKLTALLPGASDDQLRIHHVLAMNYHDLGEYRQALVHAQHELTLRVAIQSADHPDTLKTRYTIADLTSHNGDPAGALRLFQELLPDQVRVLSPSHPATLATRGDIAYWTGECGDPAGALRLSRELLPDQVRVLGHDHSDTLAIRSNIAQWTGHSGDPARALRLNRELLPDQVRVLSPSHPATLATRGNIAQWTGYSGDPGRALRLFRKPLPDEAKISGPGHPDTLATLNDIADGTGQHGDLAGALRLSQELLPDEVRVFGPSHPHTLGTRNDIAYWTGHSGDPVGALRLFQELLPDQVRVHGPDHPATLTTRGNISYWTGHSGDPAGALRLAIKLLPDRIRVCGPDHPDTLMTRNNLAYWTGRCGDPARALRLFQELLPVRERVLGLHHPDTFITRRNLSACADQLVQEGNRIGS